MKYFLIFVVRTRSLFDRNLDQIQNEKKYFSKTESRIDLKPSCIPEFVRCLEAFKKENNQFGP